MNTTKVPAVINYLRRVERLLKRGWTKGTLHDGQGNYCLLGGIQKKVPDGPTRTELFHLVRSQVFNRSGLSSLSSFNDAFTTTKEDVLGVVRSAINVARRQYHV